MENTASNISTVPVTRRRLMIGALMMAGCSAGRAQAVYPARPIKLVIPFAAGSSADVLARDVATELHAILGQPVIPENRTGAAGNIGTTFGAKAEPDGYTLTVISEGTIVMNQFLYSNLGFDPAEDMFPVARLVALQNMMLVRTDSPFKTAKEALAAIRSAPPQKFSYGSSGVGSSSHIAGALFEHMAKVQMLHVPFQGVPQAMAAIVASDIDFGFINIASALGLLKGGRLRPLAVTRLVRSPLFPDIPTLDEEGVSGYDQATWVGLGVPAGTSDAIVQKIHTALDKVFTRPAYREKLNAMAADLYPIPLASPSEFVGQIRNETAKWAPLIKTLRIQ